MHDRSDEILEVTRVLMRKGHHEEACRMLAEARDRAASEGSLDEAALYASVQGSYLVVMGRDKEAGESYQDAERLSNSDAHDKLITARHLIYGMGRPGEALQKAEEVLESKTEDSTLRQEAFSIQGLARLALNQPAEAVSSLEKLLSDLRSTPQVHSSSCDLTLVEELVKKNIATNLCRIYVELVESRASESQDREVLARITVIKSSL